MSDSPTATTPTPSSLETLLSSAADAAWREVALIGDYIGQWLPGVYPGEGQPYQHGARAADRFVVMEVRPQDVQRVRPHWWEDSDLQGLLDVEDTEDLGDQLRVTALEIADLVASKHEDYGPHAINRAPGGALNGIHVRLHDKLERAINLASSGIKVPTNHESQRDTYVDIAGYALIALAILDGSWPE